MRCNCCECECECERPEEPEPEIHFARFKGHEIICTKDAPSKNWYIQVTAPNGIRAYDGWWADSAGKSAAEAIHEAKRGAMLIKES